MKHSGMALILALCLAMVGRAWAADAWPEWRGPTGQGNSDATGLPATWSESENVAWKTAIPGLGWSTPVVADGQVWVTTAIDVRASEKDAKRRRAAATNSQPLIVSDSVSLRAVGVDLQTGEIRRDLEVLNEIEPQMIQIQNSYATPTPILEGGRLYCHYGTYGTACVETKTGEVLWKNRTLRVKHENGPGSSPILWKNLLIVHLDGIDRQYVAALDKHTGKVAWTTSRSGKMDPDPQNRKSYSTPLVVEVHGKPQLISPAADWVYAYDPASGRELWKVPYGLLGFSNAPRPVAGNGLIYSCTGYMKSELLAIHVDDRDGTSKPEVLWRYKRQVPNVSSPVLIGNEMYFVSDGGIASCIDAQTGKRHWIERIGKSFWASPVFADGRIYFFSREGKTTVIAPGKTFKKLAVNYLDGKMLATAAAVNGALILRTDKALYRLGAAVRE